MNNKILCSTGTIVGKENNFSFESFISVCHEIKADGFEFMTVKAYDGKYDNIASQIKANCLSFDVLHTLKDIGIYLADENQSVARKGIKIFEENCRFASKIGAKKVVLHLWSGLVSDSKIENNLRHIESLMQISKENGVDLLFENVPCTTNNPKVNFQKILDSCESCNFTFDTRFAAFHSQIEDEFYFELIKEKKIKHIHISDFGNTPGDFTTLRPILHPNEGRIDFDRFLGRLIRVYDGAINLESPVLSTDGLDIEKLNKSLAFIRGKVAIYSQ